VCLDMSQICGMQMALWKRRRLLETCTVGLLYTGLAAKAVGDSRGEEISTLDQAFRLLLTWKS
jgi:hypothetical protein